MGKPSDQDMEREQTATTQPMTEPAVWSTILCSSTHSDGTRWFLQCWVQPQCRFTICSRLHQTSSLPTSDRRDESMWLPQYRPYAPSPLELVFDSNRHGNRAGDRSLPNMRLLSPHRHQDRPRQPETLDPNAAVLGLALLRQVVFCGRGWDEGSPLQPGGVLARTTKQELRP